MTQPNKTELDQIQTELSSLGQIPELRDAFPSHDLVHEIQARGSCDWKTLKSICEAFSRSKCTLEALTARRDGDKDELITCRARNLDDVSLRQTLDALRSLPGIRAVTVAHLLRSKRLRPGSTSQVVA